MAQTATTTVAPTVTTSGVVAGQGSATGYVANYFQAQNTPSSAATSNLAITANATNLTAGQTFTGTGGTGTVSNSSTTTANTISAVATGNTLTNTVDLAAIGGTTAGTTGNGLSVLVQEANNATTQAPPGTGTNYVAVNATASSNTLQNVSTDVVSGSSLTQSANAISSSATGNASNTTVSGAVPVTYVGQGAAGSSTLNLGTPATNALDASANIVLSNAQANNSIATTSAASTTGNTGQPRSKLICRNNCADSVPYRGADQ
ncbi:hypothetical protein [Acidiphilium sp. C61]|uniref:hypothetical protein n=1 Tax=Acidiphilium sp. C61 TaxID=1671485 RepID=UPI00157B0A89|nr:hypothetical protein [Acidiphilium sp. C61]